MLVCVCNQEQNCVAKEDAHVGINHPDDCVDGRLLETEARRSARPADDVDWLAAPARLRHRLVRVRPCDGEKMCGTMSTSVLGQERRNPFKSRQGRLNRCETKLQSSLPGLQLENRLSPSTEVLIVAHIL